MKTDLDGKTTTTWEEMFATRTEGMKSSAIRELLKLVQREDIISFAGGMPAPELFPAREVREACDYLMNVPELAQRALQYGPTEGYGPFKEWLAHMMRKYKLPAEEENILVTSGSQQALDLVGKMFLDHGDVIITERPTYLGALQAWRAYGPEIVTVPMDDNGMRVDELPALLEKLPKKPKFIYVLPNFHNPAGVTLSFERRQKLVHIAAEQGFFIVEDDPYGELRFEGADILPIVSLHKENVVYLSTLSKTLSPGMRLGWVVAPARIINMLVKGKQGADLHTGIFQQAIAHDICSRGFLRVHIQKIRDTYRHRRTVMLEAMEKYFPKGIKWTRPQGGLFLWVVLPEGANTAEMLQEAIENKVAFVPGNAFYPDDTGYTTLRLTFATATPEKIEEGIERLGDTIRKHLAAKGVTAA